MGAYGEGSGNVVPRSPSHLLGSAAIEYVSPAKDNGVGARLQGAWKGKKTSAFEMVSSPSLASERKI